MRAAAHVDPIAHALEPMHALAPSIAPDEDLVDAQRATRDRLALLSSADRARTLPLLREALVRARPDWSDVDVRTTVATIAREVGAAPAEWPDPVELRQLDALPAWPVDALPAWVGEWVTAEARATQTPPELAAMLAVAMLAASCARVARVRVRDGWTEPLGLYVAIVQPPGSRKSAVMRDARAPIDAYEREAAERLAPEIRRTADALEIARQRHAAARTRVAKLAGGERLAAEADLDDARRELDAAERDLVRAPRLTCADITQEALARVLAEHGESIAVVDAEGCGPLAIMAGRYTDGASAIDLYLRGHAGDAYRCDRVGRDPIVLRSPTITLALALQPEVLRQLGERRDMRGLGLLARILWALPLSTVGLRAARPEPMPAGVRDAYATYMGALLALGARHDGDPHELRVSPAADDVLVDLHDRLEPRLGVGGDLEHVADAAAKLCGAVARIAALLHVAEHIAAPWASTIDGETMRRAVRIGECAMAHGRAALAAMGADPVLAEAEHLLAWMSAQQIESISRRDLYRAHRGRFAAPRALDPALEMLAEHGWIRIRHVAAGGASRRAVEHIDLSPAARDRRDGRDRRHARVPSVPSVHGGGSRHRAEVDL